MNSAIRFDDSLSVFAALVLRELGRQAIAENLFLRDASGRLTFVVLNNPLDAASSVADRSLAAKASTLLGHYVDADGFAVATPDELFDERLKTLNQARKIRLDDDVFKGEVNLVDRRIVGADWLCNPGPAAAPPLRLVFASVKGGVGRSTALCVLAADLAAQGRRVLAIDMDLEAPGLGNMLLPGDTLPEFGLLDYLVEQSLGPLDDQFYTDMIGPSWLGDGRGRVDVVPAIGRRSLQHPANVLAKIARAYLGGEAANTGADGEPSGFADAMRLLLERLADPLRYDIVLLDARAGLHETSAAAIVGLGAEILFFGLDQPQTFAGYELLLAHLATLTVDSDDDWRQRLRFVQAKAPANPAKREKFAQEMDTCLRKYLWPANQATIPQIDLAPLKDTFDVEWVDQDGINARMGKTIDYCDFPVSDGDDDGPAPVLAVLDSDRFDSFDPSSDRDALLARVYAPAFGDLLAAVTAMVNGLVKSEKES